MRLPKAFTLIEILVVISIIGILITLTFVAIIPIQRKARDSRRKADVNSMLAAANLFKADFKIYPNPTFYLGSFGGSVGDTDSPKSVNSNYALDSDIPNCNNATLGPTVNFMNLNGATLATAGKPTTAELGADPLTLLPGFASANNFLICFRYIDKILTDPKPQNGGAAVDQYQYRVSFDYGDALIAAELESTTDTDASLLFTDAQAGAGALKRYFKGTGVVVRHLDDSSDTSSFFSALTGTNKDGNYLYQCKIDSTGAAITKDNRVNNEPVTTSGASYAANANCQNSVGGLDVEPSN